VRGTNSGDIFDATGFGGTSVNAGSDGTFNEFEGMGGSDTIIGNGNTRLSFRSSTTGVVVDMVAGIATGDASVGTDTFTGVNNVRGSQGDDLFIAAHLGQRFDGQGGSDTVSYQAMGGGVFVNLGNGFVGTSSMAGATVLTSIENVTGGNGSDLLIGNNGANVLKGGGGHDRFIGNGGNDTIEGGGGVDTAVFSGFRGEYQIDFDPVLPAKAVVTDGVAARDGMDSVESVELLEFSDVILKNQRVLDITFVNLTGGKSLFGGNNPSGDDLTIGFSASNRLLDMQGGGTDIVRLGQTGFYNLNLRNVEELHGTVGNDTVQLFGNTQNGLLVDLGGGNDTLTLAPGGNTVTVRNVERVNGSGPDTVNLSSSGGPTSVTVANVATVNGTAQDDQVTVEALFGQTFVNASLNLGGGNDTVRLNVWGEGSAANLTLTGVEVLESIGGISAVTLQNQQNGLDIDLGAIGFQTLTLADGGNTVIVRNVEMLNAFGFANDVVTFHATPGVVNQTISLGFGADLLTFAGAADNLSLTLSGGDGLTVADGTTSGNLKLNLLNLQGGATFDFGGGTQDSLTLNGSGPGVNVVSVRNIESVESIGFGSDQIHILGNSEAPTTVTAGGGADMIWASADEDRFRFTATGESPYDVPFGGQRDVIYGFDATRDKFVFEGIAPTVTWQVINFDVATILRLDFNGDANPDSDIGWDMAIQLQGLTGTLGEGNFILA
jgi:hypothetical protein